MKRRPFQLPPVLLPEAEALFSLVSEPARESRPDFEARSRAAELARRQQELFQPQPERTAP